MQQQSFYEVQLTDFSPAAIAESGQCFRMLQIAENRYALTAFGRYLEVEALQEDACMETGSIGRFRFSCEKEEFDTIWAPYFDLHADYGAYRALVLSDDRYLKEAVQFGKGIRVLQQEPWEALISFILSQRRSVPAIRTSIARLCAAFGTPIVPRRLSDKAGSEKAKTAKAAETKNAAIQSLHYAFPTPKQLEDASLSALSACGLGYRASFVAEAARRVSHGELDLEALKSLPTDELLDALMQERGVGIKVASCAALFGWHRLNVLPVDIWMKRVLDTVYGGTFPAQYQKAQGVLQQYLFHYARQKKNVD